MLSRQFFNSFTCTQRKKLPRKQCYEVIEDGGLCVSWKYQRPFTLIAIFRAQSCSASMVRYEFDSLFSI